MSPNAPAPLLPSRAAAARLGVTTRHLAALRLPRVDVRRPGATRAAWRYDVAELDAWRARRTADALASGRLAVL